MKKNSVITTLFTDIGGVLLSNGWDREARKKAIKLFKLDTNETEERHHLTFDTYEVGKLSLDEYLERVVFYEKRDFTKNEFSQFMFEQSEAFPEMIELVKKIKKEFNLKVAVVSNEGYELNDYRIKTFKLNEFVDFFICSGFVHFRKPDKDIYRIALNSAQVDASQVIYLEDRPMFVQVAESLGIRGIRHIGHKSTEEKLYEVLG
ncbi:MAG: HAD-IA family hydrolase [Bacteroidetes bacterium]|nr:HAD-IA family hydrolase [Bacteroidota bacterium]MBS1932532.1 HAD-IA family hydrolase [Bacteroidota bacterium]